MSILPSAIVAKTCWWMANSVDPDQMPHFALSDLGEHCLYTPLFPNTWGDYGTCNGTSHLVHLPWKEILILIIQDQLAILWNNFSNFSPKKGFVISCKLSLIGRQFDEEFVSLWETICMKCQRLFSEKNEKSLICYQLNLPREW